MRKQFYKILTNTLSRVVGTPPYIILFTSNKCATKCRHCWYNEDWKEDNLSSNHLTFDELEKISKSMKRIDFLSLTGGESFLRDDIAEITHLFAKNTKLKRYDIPTAGFDSELICRKAIKMLEINKDIPLRIDISIDGLEDTHDYIRQTKNSFKNATETINALKNVKEKHNNLDVSIITTLSKFNQNEIGQLAKYVEQILPEGEWMVNIVRPPTRDPEATNFDLSVYKYADELISDRIKRKKFSGDRGHALGSLLTAKNVLRREIIYDILQSKRKGGGCSAGSLAGVIFNDGEVRPCESLPLSFGNIRDFDYNLPELWNSPGARKIRNHIQDTNCLCTHECFLSTSILIQPSLLVRLLKKRIFEM